MLLASNSKRIIEDWIQKFKQPSRAANPSILDPEDSISNVGSRATSKVLQKSKASSRASSKSSRRSTVSSARIAAAAKRASLTAEASMLREQQALQQEELRLQQKKQELALETEIAKAEAEERALAEAEAGISVRGSKEGFRNLAPAVKVESRLTKEPRITHHPVAEVNGREGRRRTFEDRESQYSTSSEEGLHLLMDLQRQQQEQNRNMLNIQQQQNQQVQQLLKQQQLHTLALTLPQLEVPTFAGDPIEYCRFIRAFESMIVAKTTSYSARMYYLVQYTVGDVQELMRSCLAMDSEEGYREARKLPAK